MGMESSPIHASTLKARTARVGFGSTEQQLPCARLLPCASPLGLAACPLLLVGLRLRFCWFVRPVYPDQGARFLNVLIDGRKVASNLDVYARMGGQYNPASVLLRGTVTESTGHLLD